jgi:hypothetical protein
LARDRIYNLYSTNIGVKCAVYLHSAVAVHEFPPTDRG